jgi:uncharacterized membrane protein HdeD (DUF308 family)
VCFCERATSCDAIRSVVASYPFSPTLRAIAENWWLTLLRGLLEIAGAIQMRHETEDAWLLALDGLISVIFGLSVLAFPGAGALALIWIIAHMRSCPAPY